MKKIVAAFNVPLYGVDSYDAGQVVAQLKAAEGVEAVRFFQAVEGTPRYIVEIECADDAVDSVASVAKTTSDGYSAYISDLTVRVFRLLA